MSLGRLWLLMPLARLQQRKRKLTATCLQAVEPVMRAVERQHKHQYGRHSCVLRSAGAAQRRNIKGQAPKELCASKAWWGRLARCHQ